MHALEREIACATEQEIMVDLMMSTTSAFSDRPPQPSTQSAGWPSTMVPQGSQRRIGPSTQPVAGWVAFH